VVLRWSGFWAAALGYSPLTYPLRSSRFSAFFAPFFAPLTCSGRVTTVSQRIAAERHLFSAVHGNMKEAPVALKCEASKVEELRQCIVLHRRWWQRKNTILYSSHWYNRWRRLLRAKCDDKESQIGFGGKTRWRTHLRKEVLWYLRYVTALHFIFCYGSLRYEITFCAYAIFNCICISISVTEVYKMGLYVAWP